MSTELGPGTALGRRIVVVGPSCSGKSTLAEQLAAAVAGDFVELDALFWKPGWVEPDEDEFRAKLLAAHEGDAWVTAGNYFRHTRTTIWPRAETIIWLDLPILLTSRRVIARSWRRWRNKELLWGTNTEKFWQQLMVWSPRHSLIGYSISRHRPNRAILTEAMADPTLAQTRFIRLTSPQEVAALTERAREQAATG